MQVKNQCRLDFRYQLSSTSPSIPKTIFSNVVSTDIITPPLKIETLVNKTTASVFSILTFSIKIYNESTVPISNIFVKDLAPCNLISMANTFKINCYKIRNVDPKVGYTVPFTLAPKTLVTLTFKMAVNKNSSLKTLVNSTLVEYDYIYNTEEKPLRICVYKDSNSIFIENALIKNINIDKALELPDHMPSIKEILKGCAKINISEIKLLPTPIINEDNITSFKVLIIGSVQYKILYNYSSTYSYNNNSCKPATLYYVSGFSTSITVPNGAEFFHIDNLKSTIRCFNCFKINKRTLKLTTLINLNLY